MNVIGIIAIPGMMTGAILGGSSVEQAARLQIVIMFCISASTALGSIVAIVSCLGIVIDMQHRIRDDRIDSREHMVYRVRNNIFYGIVTGVKRVFKRGERCRGEEHERLLGHPD